MNRVLAERTRGGVGADRRGAGVDTMGLYPPSAFEPWLPLLDEPGPPSCRNLRARLVRRIRREIEAGTYLTPERLDVAAERLLARLRRDAADRPDA